MKKSKLLFLGFLPVLATPIMALSCANPAKPEEPKKPIEPSKPEKPAEPKKSETPNEDKNQEFGNNTKIVYEDLKKHHSKKVLTDLIKQNKPITDLLIKNAINLDSVDSINTNNNLINNIKNEAPKIEIDFGDPTNEEIKNVIDNFYYKNLYKHYDRSKEGKQGFDFLLNNDKGIVLFPNEPEHNVPWDEDDEPFIITSDQKINALFEVFSGKKLPFTQEEKDTLLRDLKKDTKNHKELEDEISTKFSGFVESEIKKVKNFFEDVLEIQIEEIEDQIYDYFNMINGPIGDTTTLWDVEQRANLVKDYIKQVQTLEKTYSQYKDFGNTFITSDGKVIKESDLSNIGITYPKEELIKYREQAFKELREKIQFKVYISNPYEPFYTSPYDAVEKMHNFTNKIIDEQQKRLKKLKEDSKTIDFN
ncbi:hypothetical protein [Mycoplasma sp. 2575]